MKQPRLLLTGFTLLLSIALVGVTKAHTSPVVITPNGAQYIHLPFLPPCMTVSMAEGDPRKGASVELARIAAGCLIPAHWHAANTRLIVISGYGVHQIKGDAPTTLRAGSFVYLPAGTIHWFRCQSSCLTYNLQDGRDVVHWVDSRGREISPRRAFSSSIKQSVH
jgi:mannose-6-phosphate isomerase-like protein (cupin superfamily)